MLSSGSATKLVSGRSSMHEGDVDHRLRPARPASTRKGRPEQCRYSEGPAERQGSAWLVSALIRANPDAAVGPFRLKAPPKSLAFDIGRLDDRPPLLGFRLVILGERIRRLLLTRPDLLPDVGQPLAHRGIS